MSIKYENTMKVMYIGEGKRPSIQIRKPEDAYIALSKFHSKKQEHFIVFTLNANHGIIGIRIMSIGLVNRTVAHPREIFGLGIKDNAVAIILAHNHPSGSVDPSIEDVELTKRMVDAGEIMGIDVLDHIVFSKTGWLSFLGKGLLTNGSKYKGGE